MLLVYVTCKNAAEAERIGTALVKEKLAACANVIPKTTAIYEWKNKTVKSSESILLAKTTKARWKAVEKRVKQMHSYELPCVVAFEAAAASKEFEAWVSGCVNKPVLR